MRSDFSYERLAQGELGLENDDDKAHVENLRAQDRDFLRDHPPEVLATARPRKAVWSAWGAVAAAALLALGVGLGLPGAPDTRPKGADLSLFVYHKTATGTELLTGGSRLGRDDEVQLAYFSAEHHYAAILSVDGRGTVTTHLPLNGGDAVEVQTPKPELLPYSYRLDDAPDFETFYLIVSDNPFELADVKRFLRGSVRSRSPVTLPAGFTSIAFPITKQETTR